MPTNRKLRSIDELKAAANHVDYEIWMLSYAADHLDSGHSSPQQTPTGMLKNMALESFLLHFRNLRAFLCPSMQTCSDDDIVASDFLGEPVARDVVLSSPFLKDKKRLDKMLAHLSYSRETHIQAGEDGWLALDMKNQVFSEHRKFLASLPADRAGWFYA
jgi:hypothetical protein